MSSKPTSLEDRTRQALAKAGVTRDSKLLVAVSGGPDSMALLRVLVSLRDAHSSLVVAHVNHGLRAESDAEEAGVREAAESLGVACHVLQADTRMYAAERRLGLEEAARDIRYEFFTTLAREEACGFILTAHTANDQAETVLMRMMRGTGVHGLSGIPRLRILGSCLLLRPWLDVRREEIQDHLNMHAIEFFTDSSNDELDFERNRVRNLLLPKLRMVFPNRDPVDALNKLANRMAEIDTYLAELATEKLESGKEGRALRSSALVGLTPHMFKTVVEMWLGEAYDHYALEDDEAMRLMKWLVSDSNAIALRQGIRIEKNEQLLRLTEARSLAFESAPLPVGASLSTPYGLITATLENVSDKAFSPNIAIFSAEVLTTFDLCVRPWHAGDRMHPFGLAGRSKLVSDILTDAKLTGATRASYPVVMRCEEILWVPGIRRSDVAPISSETTRVLVLEFSPIGWLSGSCKASD